MHEKSGTADGVREYLLRNFMEEITPSQKALAYIKKEVGELF
jgi:predicted RNA-binding protein with PUA-like domain